MQSSAGRSKAGIATQDFWREDDTVQVTGGFVLFSLRLPRWPSLVPTELMLLVRKEWSVN